MSDFTEDGELSWADHQGEIYDRKLDIIKKIKSRTQKTAGCWYWTGEHDKGKAKLTYKRTSIYPAIVMWELYNKEEVPEDMVVKLSCENKSCVNPNHTYLSRRTYPWLQ